MPFTLKLAAVNSSTGWEVTASVTGDFEWVNISKYPGLPKGDAAQPLSDDNPAAVFAANIGRLSSAMKVFGVSDTDSDPLTFSASTKDAAGMLAFQAMAKEILGEMLRIGVRKAAKHGVSFNPGQAVSAWNKAKPVSK